MAAATLKKTDMRYKLRPDPKELAAQYRLSVHPGKRNVSLVKRARPRKSKGASSTASHSSERDEHEHTARSPPDLQPQVDDLSLIHI